MKNMPADSPPYLYCKSGRPYSKTEMCPSTQNLTLFGQLSESNFMELRDFLVLFMAVSAAKNVFTQAAPTVDLRPLRI
ncbi:hypothetical protein CHK39_15090 [Salmonella enterica]|nr:hypothetical protein [Salmonella enterica]